jgi:glycosyltransferase involved in cell wall biosynthesis
MPTLRITAIVPVFNGSRYIDDALASIAAQTRQPDEIIVVNDGSTDDSAEVIAAAVAHGIDGIPVRVITQENAGQSAARNAAVKQAAGDVVAFLDQDDRWYPEHLAILSDGFATDPTLGWVYSDFDEIDVDTKVTTREFLATNRVPQPKSNVGAYVVGDAMILPTASVVRVSALEGVGGFDPQLSGYEDDDLFFRLFRAGWACRFEPRSLAQFRVHALSSSARASFGVSREIYFGKISAELPDDPRLNRYYVSDLLLPRIMAATLSDYAVALGAGNKPAAKAIALSATRMASKARMSGRRRFGLAVIRHPGLCRFLLRVVGRMPRGMRPKMSPAFRLN